MQLHPGRPANQWRGFAADDAANSGEPITRYDSARHRAAWRHQHRSGDGGYANAEHLGMRREHDDVFGDARHHGAGQRHGRRGNPGRISAGLLTGRKRRLHGNPNKLFIKRYLVVRLVCRAYFLK
jgi:hypothetical protein